MKNENTQKPSKNIRKEVKEWTQATALCLVMSLPMLASAASGGTPSWATETVGHLDKFITGLKWVGGAIATIVFLWCAYEIMWGGKRLQDMKGWIIGALMVASVGHIVKLFLPDTNY